MPNPRSAAEWATRWYKDWIDSSEADAHPAIAALTKDFDLYALQQEEMTAETMCQLCKHPTHLPLPCNRRVFVGPEAYSYTCKCGDCDA